MSTKLDEKVEKYIKDYKEKVGGEPDADLMRKVTVACGPSIYNSDAETISSSSASEMENVKKNFLIKKLGLEDNEKLDAALDAAIEKYGRSNRNKYRPVINYILTKHFNKEDVFK